MSAEELMGEFAKAGSPLSTGIAVEVRLHGPGLITLSARSPKSHRHIPVALDVGTMTREEFAELMVAVRTVLARAMSEGI